jgi:hypothetical protein
MKRMVPKIWNNKNKLHSKHVSFVDPIEQQGNFM